MTDRLFSLEARTALVTGARTGIGRGAALALADAGADVVLWGRSGGLEEVTAEVEARGVKAATLLADLADPEAVRAAAAAVLEEHRIDILVNNAGIIRRAPAAQASFSDWREVQAVNVDAVFLLCQMFGAPMLARGAGKIINVASVLSYAGGLNVSGYVASKHAVAGLTRALADEWAGAGVNVNAIAPGYIATEQTEPLQGDPVREPAIMARIPVGRWGTPEDLAGAFIFLASAASDFVHGEVLAVDGGWLAR